MAPQKRPQTAVEISSSLTDMFLNEPVSLWNQTLEDMSIPEYNLPFAGMITIAMELTFNETVVDALAPVLLDAFGVNQGCNSPIFTNYS
jgi:hypothetical protein